MTDQERIEQLEWAVTALAENQGRFAHARNEDTGVGELRALVKDVQERRGDRAAAERKRLLEAELANLGLEA